MAGIILPVDRRATADAAMPVGSAQGLGIPTSPGTGEVASLSEPERALSLGRAAHTIERNALEAYAWQR